MASRSTPFMFDKAGEFSSCCEYKVAARPAEMERRNVSEDTFEAVMCQVDFAVRLRCIWWLRQQGAVFLGLILPAEALQTGRLDSAHSPPSWRRFHWYVRCCRTESCLWYWSITGVFNRAGGAETLVYAHLVYALREFCLWILTRTLSWPVRCCLLFVFCFPVFSLGGVVDAPGYRWPSHLQLVTNQLPSRAALVVMFHSPSTFNFQHSPLYDCCSLTRLSRHHRLALIKSLYLLPFPAYNASALNIHLQPNTPTASQWWNTCYS